jgi:hypothetical protein
LQTSQIVVRDRKKLERECTKLCRRLVVEIRDCHRCQRCGNRCFEAKIDWAHVKNRGARSLVFVPWASLALCTGCHFFFDGNKGNRLHPGEGMLWWREKFPDRALALDAWERNRNKPRVDRHVEKLWLQQELAKLETP